MIDYVGDGLACKIKNIYCLTFYREALLTGPWGKLPGSRNEAREVQGEAALLVLTWTFRWGSAEQWGQELLLSVSKEAVAMAAGCASTHPAGCGRLHRARW